MKLMLILLIAVAPSLAQEIISSFSVEQTSTSARITLILTIEITGNTGCFLDKLTFTNEAQTRLFSPRFPGMCNFSNSGNAITATLHISDYIDALQSPQLTDLSDSYLIIDMESAASFLPGVAVNEISTPLLPSAFIPFTAIPTLVSFDLDLTANKVLLHFDSLMNAGTFNINLFMILGVSPSPTVLTTTLPTSYTTTLCITLTDSERTLLMNCQSTMNCSCFFTSGLINDYNGNSVAPVAQSGPLEVSLIRIPSVLSSAVFIRLSLSYTGCNAVHTLSEDEVYVLRPNEIVTKVECFADDTTNSNNIRPQISRENSFIGSTDAVISEDYIVYNWPLHVYLNFSEGLPPSLYGQYICRSEIGSYSRNYIHDNNSNIELLGGSNIQVPLYDPLTISMFYGNYQQINISQVPIVLMVTDVREGVPRMPVYTGVNRFHVDIIYDMIGQNNNGMYEIRVMEESNIIARRSISIEVTKPILTVIPEVATILPGQTGIVLMCMANSNNLQIMWFSDGSDTVLSSNSTYREQVPSEIQIYNCSVGDPDRNVIVASTLIPVRNVPETLSVWRDGGMYINNNSVLEIVNRFSGDLSLQCLEHVESIVTNLTWYILPDNGSLITLSSSSGKDRDDYTASISGNQATLIVVNSDNPFRGLLRCSSSSGLFVKILVVEETDDILTSCKEDIDPVWNIQWNSTTVGRSDIQSCPMDGVGMALRQCNMDGEWSGRVDITDCRSTDFISLKNMAESMVFQLSNAYSSSGLEDVVAKLIDDFNNVTQPKSTTHFPLDLGVANDILEGVVTVLSEGTLTSIHTELVDVFDNLLNKNNVEGWQLLTQNSRGSQMFLSYSELFGAYLVKSLPIVAGNKITALRDNIAFSAVSINTSVEYTYPMNLSKGAQIRLPADLINEQQMIGVITIIMENLELPEPMFNSSADPTRIVSPIMSIQLLTTSGRVDTFSNDQAVVIEFLTERILRANNPTCVFWDTSVLGGRWSKVITSKVERVENGEFKQFKVRCLSDHLTAFAIAIDLDDFSEFRFSIPVYIGCGFIIFSSVLSIFSLFLSCAFDTLRRYSIVALFTHLSFVTSLLCAYIAFLAGIEQALNNRIGCAAVAGLLHYFFTAAFSWLLCEGLLVLFLARFSQYPGLFFIMFIIGWGLPGIPTAISLGLLHETYGTTTQCWFYFDGQILSDVVLGFLIPKLLIIGITLIILMIGCCTNYKSGMEKKNRYIRINMLRILWLIWISIFLFLIFLSASWVFALLLVNVYGLDSEVLGWIFMAASIILAVWVFIFCSAVMVINQKIDYERLWSSQDPSYPPSDPGKGRGYEFMTMLSDRDLTGRRSRNSVIVGPPANPVFGAVKYN